MSWSKTHYTFYIIIIYFGEKNLKLTEELKIQRTFSLNDFKVADLMLYHPQEILTCVSYKHILSHSHNQEMNTDTSPPSNPQNPHQVAAIAQTMSCR